MLDLSKVQTTDRKVLAEARAFVEWYNTLFPDGEIPDLAEFQDTADRSTMTMRDAWIARFYNEGINIHPEYGIMKDNFVGPDIAKAARALMKVFPRASKASPGPQKLAEDIRNTQPWFTGTIDEFLKDKATRVTKFSKLKKTMFGDSGTTGRVGKFLQEGKGAGSSGGVTTFGSVISDESMKGMLEGFNKIPDDDLREATWVGSFGSRGTATINIAINREIAMASAQSDQYWDPVNKILVATETGTRKGLPPTRGVDPITEAILDRRWQAAVDAGETRLFPDNIQVKDISTALKTYVYKNITSVDQTLLGKDPVGIIDLRKLVGSWMLKTMGQGGKVDQLLSHEGDAMEEAANISRVGRKRYFTVEGDPSIYQDFLNRTVQRWGKLLGAGSFDDIPAKVGLNATVTFEDTVPYFDFDETDVDSGDAVTENRPQGTPKTEEELKLEAKERESGIVRRTKENIQKGVQADLTAEQTKAQMLKLRAENIQAEEDLPPPPERIETVSDDTKVAAKKGFGRLAKRLERLGGRAGKKVLSVLPGVGAGLQAMDAESRKQELMATGKYTEQQVDDFLRNKIVYGETPAGLYSDLLEGAEAVGDIFSDVPEEDIKKRDLERMESQMRQIGIQAGPEA